MWLLLFVFVDTWHHPYIFVCVVVCLFRLWFSRCQNTTLRPGDHAVVNVREASGHTLRGLAIARTTLKEHVSIYGDRDRATTIPATGTAAAVKARNEEAATKSTGNKHAFV